MVNRITRNGDTMATYYAPPGEAYCVKKWKACMGRILKVLKPVHFSMVSEPFPDKAERKSTYHTHVHLVWPDGFKKQITPAAQLKIQQILKVDLSTHDYTNKPKAKHGGLAKTVSDGNYSRGLSKKDKANGGSKKTHYHTWESEGYNEWFTAKEEEYKAQKNAAGLLDGCDPTKPSICIYTMMNKHDMDPVDIFAWAEENDCTTLAMCVVSMYDNWCSQYATLKKIKAEMKLKALADLVPNDMQEQAMAIIEEATNDRANGQLTVFVDPKGNSGKSVLQSMLYKKHGAPEFPNCKTADLAKAYCYEDMVNFNLARHTDVEKVNYACMENLLDGKIFSTKYHSNMKRVAPPKINIFCNEDLKYERMSLDRWNIYHWDGEAFTKKDVHELIAPKPFVPYMLRSKKRKLSQTL